MWGSHHYLGGDDVISLSIQCSSTQPQSVQYKSDFEDGDELLNLLRMERIALKVGEDGDEIAC